MLTRVSFARTRFLTWWGALSGLSSDALLYGVSAVFALGLGLFSHQGAQWQWGYLATTPYALFALVAFGLHRLQLRRTTWLRVGLLALVMLGTVAIPLGLEARWRVAQPEVGVIQRAGDNLSKDKNLYPTYDKHGKLIDPIEGIPSFESFFPYFPLMSVFGLPSAETHKTKGLTDPRIAMSLLTLLASGLALGLLRASSKKKIRVAQCLLVLPTGALFLSTGGDDMPILALTLLGVVALQRRQNNFAGISLGLAAAMKLTAWPMAFGALLVARDDKDRSAWLRVALWIVAVVAVTVTPFAIRAPWAFMSNVFAFPLGLTSVTSPAASALPGHILTTLWAPAGHILAPVTFLVGGYFLTTYLRRHWPLTLAQLLAVLSVVFLTMMCVATATRIGYVIYPLNFALWSWALTDSVVPERELVQTVSEF
ncbi:MAG: glycosyltransferase 87 family protein [Acidimicrobiales bacterium]